jgi:transcriptional regulator with XRE-family HTH domain
MEGYKKPALNGHELRVILGKGIRFYRQQRQLSQAALAEKANISVTFLSNIERGLKYPTSDTLSALSNGLEVEAYELFRHDHSPAAHRGLFERFKKDITKNVLDTLTSVYRAYD